MANLGFVLGGVGQFDKAIELLMECRQLCEKNYPVSHDLTSSVIKNLSRVYQQAGQYDTAIELLVDRARQLRGETPNLNPSAANFRELLRQLAECDLEAGFPANAEEVCRSWLEITSKLEEPVSLGRRRGEAIWPWPVWIKISWRKLGRKLMPRSRFLVRNKRPPPNSCEPN